jgi:hypothetical protein
MAQEQEVKEAPKGTSGGLEAHGQTFHEAYGHFWQVPIFFMASAGHDKKLNPSFRAGVVYNLGAIAGINEMLIKAYIFGLADGVLDKPENIKEYTDIMLRLKALYEDYKSREKVKAVDLLRAVEDIVGELFAFVREIMSQLKAQA